MSTIAILHPGAMGAAIGGALVEVGHRVVWLPQGRSQATRRRAADAGLLARDRVDGCDIVIAVCPPASARSTARRVAGFSGLYVDANAIAPETAREVSEIVTAHGASYVDGAVVGPPPTAAATTRLYLSGPHAGAVAAVFGGSLIEPRVLDGELTASSLKMSYGAWTKISAALLLATRAAAARLGVEEALVAEWALSQPSLSERSEHASRSAEQKGWRWEAEMREIAKTFHAAGQPTGFGEAAAELFARYPRPGEAPDDA